MKKSIEELRHELSVLLEETNDYVYYHVSIGKSGMQLYVTTQSPLAFDMVIMKAMIRFCEENRGYFVVADKNELIVSFFNIDD